MEQLFPSYPTRLRGHYSLERLFRAYAPRLQRPYDLMPPLIQSLLASTRGWFLTRIRYSAEMFDLLQELLSHEAWSAEQISAYQLKALQQTLEHARETVPYYSAYPRLRLKRPEDIAQLPVLTRDVVRGDPERFISRSIPIRNRVRATTTGTTGASLKCAYTALVMRRAFAFQMRQRVWAGMKPREPRVTLFSSRVVPADRSRPPYWTYNLLERQVLLSIYHLSERSIPDYYTFLQRHQDQVLEGFPSVLGILADLVLQYGKPIRMRAVFTDGEPLYPFLREKISQAFQGRVYDQYGNSEFGGLIQECEQGRMHMAPDYSYLEILDDNHQPVRAGEEGYFVWTGFINDTMPLIRYRIGDRGCWEDSGPCACGRAFPLVVPTITRESDLLRCPDGRIFSPRALNQVLKRASLFRFCQFVQDQPAHVVVRAVPSNDGASKELAEVQVQLQRLLGKEIQVQGELAAGPIVRAGGKIPLIVQQARV